MKVELTTSSVVGAVIQLLDKYTKCFTPSDELLCVLPEDFLTTELDAHTENMSTSEKEAVALLYFTVLDYKPFLDIVSENFFEHMRRRHRDDKNTINVMVYLVLFHLGSTTWQNVRETLLHLHPLKALNLLRFLTADNALVRLVLDGCKVFDKDFVMERIVQPLEKPDNLLKSLRDAVRDHVATEKRNKKIPSTVPIQPLVLCRTKREQKAPTPDIVPLKREPVAAPPPTLYRPPNMEARLAKVRELNRLQAQELFDQAQQMAFRCAAPQASRRTDPVAQPVKEQYRANPTPDFSKVVVPVKSTATTVLREGARLRNDEKKEVARLEAMLTGGANHLMYERLETELREQQELEQLEALERKHLQGLLTREEAALAKQRLQQRQKERVAAFKDEREEWERRLAEFRAAEEQKIRQLVARSRGIEQAARNRQLQIQQRNRKCAQELNRETKARLDQALKEKEEELTRRIELIRELRVLHRIRQLRVKEFDLAETPGIGLLCEMSIAELRERMMLLRQDLHKELEQRRARAKELRANQRRLVTDTEQFIRQQRIARKATEKNVRSQTEPVRPRDTEELRVLRQKLEEARLQRTIK